MTFVTQDFHAGREGQISLSLRRQNQNATLFGVWRGSRLANVIMITIKLYYIYVM
jgi:hypothetical protein